MRYVLGTCDEKEKDEIQEGVDQLRNSSMVMKAAMRYLGSVDELVSLDSGLTWPARTWDDLTASEACDALKVLAKARTAVQKQ